VKALYRDRRFILACTLGLAAAWVASAQLTRSGRGRDFMYPEFYPLTSGVARKKSVVRAEEYEVFPTNNMAALWNARIEFFGPDGTNLEWTALAREAVVDLNTREVSGTNRVFFRTADDRLFVTGEGFLWQQSNSVLILSNKTFTWTETRTITGRTNKMKTLMAASLIATARLTAAELELPPSRPGLTITAAVNILNLKSNQVHVLYSNNVLVTYPPVKTNDPITYLRCDWLTGRRGTNGQIEEIVAHGLVALDRGDEHARGNYAIYTATNEMLALVGMFDPGDTNHPRPYLYSPQGTNSGDYIIYDRRQNTLTTYGAVTEVPANMLRTFSSTNAASTNKARATNAADRPKAAPPPK
jgi:hypothetical protein